jgi:hypothetical protein
MSSARPRVLPSWGRVEEAGGLKAGGEAFDPLVAPHPRLVGAHLGRPPGVTGSRQADNQHAGARAVVVQGDHRAAVVDRYLRH